MLIYTTGVLEKMTIRKLVNIYNSLVPKSERVKTFSSRIEAAQKILKILERQQLIDGQNSKSKRYLE